MRAHMFLFRLYIIVSTEWVDRYLVIQTAVQRRDKKVC